MGRVIVHLGAHRTATTLLQQTLTKNSEMLRQAGVELLVPPRTRRQVFDGLIKRPSLRSDEDEQTAAQSARKLRNRFRKFKDDDNTNLFVSEENILGTMRDCRDCTELYPELVQRLEPYREAFAQVDCIVIGIRNTHHWWCSALAYTVGEYAALPTSDEIKAIAKSSRTWADIISDVKESFPDVPVVVREHPYAPRSIGVDLANQTDLKQLAEIAPLDKVSNSAASEDALRRKLEARDGDSSGLREMMPGGVFDPFDQTQTNNLNERFESDVAVLQASKDDQVLFYPRARERSSRGVNSNALQTPICLLHIGKTGGTFLRSVLKAADYLPTNLQVLKHSDTLESTRRRYGNDRRLAFVIRDPRTRFVSAFESRMRQGRPTYNSQWSSAEATAFMWFPDANALAEALGSDDERMRSAASFAMENIQHLRLNYQHFLTSAEALEREKENIQFCIDLAELDTKLPDALAGLGITSQPNIEEAKRHAAPGQPTRLSALAERNLRDYWDKEFEIYHYCRTALL